jgi:hypothetical protein
MSFSEEGKYIYCDGANCLSHVKAPVALRSLLTTRDGLLAGLEGWVFVGSGNAARHYCPRCGSSLLQRLTQESEAETVPVRSD